MIASHFPSTCTLLGGAFLMSCLSTAACISTSTLPTSWSVTNVATTLPCDDNLPLDKGSFQPVSTHHLTITDKTGIYWGEGWTADGKRVFYHTPSRKMDLDSGYQPNVKVLDEGERVQGLLKRNDSEILVFYTKETVSITTSHLSSDEDLGTFELIVANLLTGEVIRQYQLNSFLYASDLDIHFFDASTWLLSGYTENFLWSSASLSAPDDQVPTVQTLPPGFSVASTSQSYVVFADLGIRKPELILHAQKITEAYGGTAIPPTNTTHLPTNTTHLPFTPDLSAVAITSPTSLLVAFIAKKSVQAESTEKTPAAETSASQPATTYLHLGSYDLSSHKLTLRGKKPLSDYVSHERLAFQSYQGRWYLHHTSSLGGRKVLYWHSVAELRAQAESPDTLPAPQLRRPSRLAAFFGARQQSPHTVFGPFAPTSHLMKVMDKQDYLSLLFRTQDASQHKHFFICILKP